MKHKLALGWVLLGAAPLAPALTICASARPANVPLHTPRPGSRERAAIMNAARIPATKHYGGKRVTFTSVNSFRVGGGWAHFSANPVDSQGRPLGELDFSALLHLEQGKWRVVEWAEHGDVIQIDWAKEHPNVPLNVLGLRPSDVR